MTSKSTQLVTPYTNVRNAITKFWGAPVTQNKDGIFVCPGFEGPTFANSPWDFVQIKDMKTPGVARVSGPKFRDVDKKKKSGGDGARITIHGIEPALISIALIIWTPDQLLQLERVWGTVFPPTNKKPPSKKGQDTAWPPVFAVYHPYLDLINVSALQFVRMDGPIDGPVARAKTFTLNAVEYIPPSKENVTSSAKAVQAIGGGRFEPTYAPPSSNAATLGPTAPTG